MTLRGHALGGSRRMNGHWQSGGDDGRIHVTFDFPVYRSNRHYNSSPWFFNTAPFDPDDPGTWQNNFLWCVPYTNLTRGKTNNRIKDGNFVKIEIQTTSNIGFFISGDSSNALYPAIDTGSAFAEIAPYIGTVQNLDTFFASPIALSREIEFEPYTAQWIGKPDIALITKTSKIIFYATENWYGTGTTGILTMDHVFLDITSVDKDIQEDAPGMPTATGYVKIDGVTSAEALSNGYW